MAGFWIASVALARRTGGPLAHRTISARMADCKSFFSQHLSRGRIPFTREELLRALGARAKVPRLTTLARAYENAAVMRLGYLLELAGHEQQAAALDQFAEQANSVKLLDPTSKLEPGEMSGRWKIVVNRPLKPGS